MRNVETTQAIYQAFGKGDVPFILAQLSDDVVWEQWADNSATKSGAISYLMPRRGKAGVGEFFAAVGGLQMHDFQVHNFLGGGNQVVVSVSIEFTNPKTGKRLRDEELHLWTFDDAGKVISMRHYVDTAKHLAASA